MADETAPLLRVTGVTKHYGGVRALEDVRFDCRRGRIHALLGENGAGKSTLIKILAGVVRPDAGEVLLDGTAVTFADPAAASEAGIACIFQELSLLPDLTVADNIAIADPPRRFGLIDRAAQQRLAERALARVGADDIHPQARVGDLPLSRRQLVEIAKALARDPKILILDEATSALTAADVAKVFRMLKQLRAEGMAIIYISHRMHEIAELADDCTVYRNGRWVSSFPAGTRSDDEIVEMMIGREYRSVFPPRPDSPPQGEPVLRVRDLSWAGQLERVDLEVRPGEIVGLGGLDGQGQRQLLLALFGTLVGASGTVEIDGRPVRLASPQHAKAAGIGIALIPEDRKNEGLMLPMSVRENLSFAAVERFSRLGVVDRRAEATAIDAIVELLQIKADGIDGPVAALSGGNQQKVVIGKWLMNEPRIILLNDPTRGIDVGTKQEIYQLLRRLAEAGAAILLYSTDYDELIGCCDRVLVLYDGSVVRTLAGDELTEHNLVAAALNLAPADLDAPAAAAASPAALDSASPEGSPQEDPPREDSPAGPARRDRRRRPPAWSYWFAAQRGTLLAVAIFAVMFAVYGWGQEVGLTASIINTAANKGALLALVAMAQTLPVLTGGLDLSVGMIFMLGNCLAATIVNGSPLETALGIVGVLAVGLACGAINGLIVVYGRLQPIIVTLATGAVYFGIALVLRPEPGGSVNFELADLMTRSYGPVPATVLLLIAVVALVWIPYRRSVLGRAAYALGSSEQAAYMSGVPIARAKILAYALSGLLAALAGLLLTFVTYSGAAKASLGADYTLNSIGSVVIGGTSLFGGAGSAIGSIFGAFVMRTVGDLLIVFDINPVLQPLFVGLVLLLAVSLGSLRLLRIRNKLDLYR